MKKTTEKKSTTKTSYRLNRIGDFTIKTFGEFHCGTSDVLRINYRVNVTCDTEMLDSRGFLFDQVKVDGWFKSQRATDLSCEKYTVFCARQIYKLIVNENNGLTPSKIELALSPAPYAAEITFVWEQEK